MSVHEPALATLGLALPTWLMAHHPGWIAGLAFGIGLLIGALLLRRAAQIEQPAAPVVPSLRSQVPTFMAEVDRARRYERALAVLVLKLEDADTVGAALGLVDRRTGHGIVSERARALIQSARQVMFWNVGYVLKDLLRENDVAACDLPEQRYVVVLPEADEEDALNAATRLGEQLYEATGVQVRQGVAVYRQHGLTIEHLMESAAAMSDRMASGQLAQIARERAASKIRVMPERSSVK